MPILSQSRSTSKTPANHNAGTNWVIPPSYYRHGLQKLISASTSHPIMWQREKWRLCVWVCQCLLVSVRGGSDLKWPNIWPPEVVFTFTLTASLQYGFKEGREQWEAKCQLRLWLNYNKKHKTNFVLRHNSHLAWHILLLYFTHSV